jgi:hypothetical protein
LKYSEKRGFIKLEIISKQQVRDKKIPNKTYISRITPDHTLIKPKDFYAVKRYYKINFYPDDIFVFRYNRNNIEKIKDYFGELDKNSHKDELNLGDFSMENLEKIQKILKIILDELEMQDINRLAGNKILIKKFEERGIFYEDVDSVIKKINSGEKKDIIRLIDKSIILANEGFTNENFRELKKMDYEQIGLKIWGISKEDLEKNIIIIVKDLNQIKKIKKKIDNLTEPSNKKGVKINSRRAFFDKNKSVLFIGENQIKIRKFSDQYHLLRIIFENEKETPQEWFFSEIAERCDNAKKLPDKKFYNAIYQLKIKINIAGINDFFDKTTNQSFKINEKYLIKS